MKLLESTCKDRNIDFTVDNNHIRCLAHVINLTIQAIFFSLKVGYVKNKDELLNKTNEIIDIILKVLYNFLQLI